MKRNILFFLSFLLVLPASVMAEVDAEAVRKFLGDDFNNQSQPVAPRRTVRQIEPSKVMSAAPLADNVLKKELNVLSDLVKKQAQEIQSLISEIAAIKQAQDLSKTENDQKIKALIDEQEIKKTYLEKAIKEAKEGFDSKNGQILDSVEKLGKGGGGININKALTNIGLAFSGITAIILILLGIVVWLVIKVNAFTLVPDDTEDAVEIPEKKPSFEQEKSKNKRRIFTSGLGKGGEKKKKNWPVEKPKDQKQALPINPRGFSKEVEPGIIPKDLGDNGEEPYHGIAFLKQAAEKDKPAEPGIWDILEPESEAEADQIAGNNNNNGKKMFCPNCSEACMVSEYALHKGKCKKVA